MEKDPNEIGVLWEKKSKSGNTFYSGYAEINGARQEIVMFRINSNNEKAPHFRILKSKPMEGGGLLGSRQVSEPQRSSYNPDDDPAVALPAIDASRPEDDEVDVKDIPF